MNPTLPVLLIDDESVAVTPHAEHEFTLTSKDVARGYGVSPEVLRTHKRDHADELTEAKHWITVGNPNGGAPITLWTKRGVIRLGFFIRSDRAKRFRDAAEDIVLGATTPQPEARADLLLRTVDALIAHGVSADLAAHLAAGACGVPRLTNSRPGRPRRFEPTQLLASLGETEMTLREWHDAATKATGISKTGFYESAARLRDLGVVAVRDEAGRALYSATKGGAS